MAKNSFQNLMSEMTNLEENTIHSVHLEISNICLIRNSIYFYKTLKLLFQ